MWIASRCLKGVSTVAAVAVLLVAGPAFAQDAGEVKVAKGTVHIERANQKVAVSAGTRVREQDSVVTGADGSVGITFADSSRLSLGPSSRLTVEKFSFNSTTHQGAFETALDKGSLAAVSGKLAKQSPEAMKVRTPAAVLGVRGTEFVVRTGDGAN
jgi:hypothetical protein